MDAALIRWTVIGTGVGVTSVVLTVLLPVMVMQARARALYSSRATSPAAPSVPTPRRVIAILVAIGAAFRGLRARAAAVPWSPR